MVTVVQSPFWAGMHLNHLTMKCAVIAYYQLTCENFIYPDQLVLKLWLYIQIYQKCVNKSTMNEPNWTHLTSPSPKILERPNPREKTQLHLVIYSKTIEIQFKHSIFALNCVFKLYFCDSNLFTL